MADEEEERQKEFKEKQKLAEGEEKKKEQSRKAKLGSKYKAPAYSLHQPPGGSSSGQKTVSSS